MQTNYTSRVILILVVIFAGLFGIPFIADGIFKFKEAFNPTVSLRDKLNLRPGIDIAGGTSLLYEIKTPPGGVVASGPDGTLAERVAAVLKKRVDPNGVRNLVWRPQGDTRLEIQIPRSAMVDDKAKKTADDYRDLRKQLDAYNISYAQVVSVVESTTGDERAAALDRLAKGSEARANLFAVLRSQFDKKKDLQAKLAELKKAEKPDEDAILKVAEEIAATRIAYDKEKNKIESTNLAVEDVEALIESPGEANNKQFAELKTKFPERKPILDKLETLYPQYLRTKGAISDASDLKMLLRGSGVLAFHILVENPQVEQPEMIQRMTPEGDGPSPKAGDRSRWFEVDKPSEFGRGHLMQVWRGKNYALAWTTPDKSMVHKEGGGDWSLQRAYPTQNQAGESVVGFEFDDAGAALFAQLTGTNLQKPLGTILDGKIITAPNINSQIGKSGIIEGKYSDAERNYIISTLSAGSLPAQLEDEPISERDVSSTLGADTLRAGLWACVVGLIVAATFLVIYYHLSGLIAVVGVVINLVIILGVSAMMGATFTLPGIAALVLTIGMAVDANVLIFERFREEQVRGLSLKLAMRNAYDRAFTAILDSNVTTAITSGFLIYFGSEEVKGFGLTLLIGIISSLFSALFVSRTIFGILIERYGVRKLGSLPLSFPKWDAMLKPNIDWMGKVKYFLAFSLIFTVLGLTAFVTKTYQRKMFDVEFAAGTEVVFSTKEKMKIDDVRDRIEKKKEEIPQPAIVAIGDSGTEFSIVTANDNRAQVITAVEDAMGDKLNVAISSTYTGAKATVEEAMKLGVIQPIKLTNNRFLVDGKEVPDADRHIGGPVIILKNITPPLSTAEIANRTERTLAALGGSVIQKIDVERLDGKTDPNQPVETAIVMASNKNFAFEKDEGDWKAKLVNPLWKAIEAGVTEPAKLQKVTNFDPQVAGDTQRDALFATIGSMVFIMIYIWIRFGDPKYGTATIFAMIHDTVMVIAAIGLSHWIGATAIGQFLLVEPFRVNMTLVAAVLTVMGYSMVDTIVVFDRIREIRGKFGVISRKLINDAINQTLSRTLLTAGTTLLTLLVMYVFGGAAIHGFSFILLLGIIIGTYSSLAVAAPLLLIGAPKQPTPVKSTKTERVEVAKASA